MLYTITSHIYELGTSLDADTHCVGNLVLTNFFLLFWTFFSVPGKILAT